MYCLVYAGVFRSRTRSPCFVRYTDVDDKLKKQSAAAATSLKRMEEELKASGAQTAEDLQRTTAKAQSTQAPQPSVHVLTGWKAQTILYMIRV